MNPNPLPDVTTLRYKRHRFPVEIIAHSVWLCSRFPLSLRHIEDLLAERGIEVLFQTVAEWAAKFGRQYARSIRLWRAVDADDLDALIQSRRNKTAALRLMRKLLKGQCVPPRLLIIDKLRSYAAAKGKSCPVSSIVRIRV